MTPQNRWLLIGISGPVKGREFVILAKEVHIGRTSDNDIVIPDKSISRHHASIFLNKQELWIQDMESKNGTYINSKPIAKAYLAISDIIHIGEAGFQIATEPISKSASQISNSSEQPLVSEQNTSGEKQILRQASDWLRYTVAGKLVLFSLALLSPFIIYAVTRSLSTAPTQQIQPQTSQLTDQERPTLPRPIDENLPIEPVSSDSTSPDTAKPLSTDELTRLRNEADVALQTQDYPTAYQLLKKLTRALPQDARLAQQLEMAEKAFKTLLKSYDEAGIREYEKLNYERALDQWRKVLALANDVDNELYQRVIERSREAHEQLMNKQP